MDCTWTYYNFPDDFSDSDKYANGFDTELLVCDNVSNVDYVK